MEYAKKADASGRYNRAFERYRSQWLKAHLNVILLITAVLIAGTWCAKRVIRRKKAQADKTAAPQK